MPDTEVFYSQTSWPLRGWLESENAWWPLTLGVSKVGKGHRKGEWPHSFCQFNEKEMKASVLMTEFHSEGAMGRIQEQGCGGELGTQQGCEMCRVCIAPWSEHWAQKRMTWALISTLPLTVCVVVSYWPYWRYCIPCLICKQYSEMVKSKLWSES